ncbi:MAG: RecX family transcriptional regulator [Prolixibacteraceae bacterium]|jgi:regulatory protein|nr:RecX family transcriptional regulator [Prolixibacteraceae bacterium]HNQ36493.1 regulatory protein RecX [Prolixibacteraceae bacterium]HPJ79965.1 regulatory protein RecX [Prolixibacteraceae bacterium]HRV88551.1 regulatory protein RecX [Prolixibacteraceae bacterium]
MENEEKQDLEIYRKMAALCSRSEQCVADIRKKIRALGANSLAEEQIIAKLEKENFLNDERYAISFAGEKFKINKWGRVKIRYYLKMKGIGDKEIRAGLDSIDNEAYVALLVKTMKEKAKGLKGVEKYQKMAQVIRFTQGRGFEPDLIHRHLEEALG